MEVGDGGDQLEEGWTALEAAQWDAARLAFEAALAVQETPDARRLGSRVVVPGRVEEGSLSESGPSRSTTAAVEPIQPLGSLYGSRTSTRSRGARRLGAAGLSRAERALGAGRCAGHGWVAVERARHAQSGGVRRARTAGDGHRAGGWRRGSRGLCAQPARTGRGQRRAPGRGDAAARGGDGGRLGRTGAQRTRLAGVLQSDHGLYERGRWSARQWCELVDEFAREHEATPLLGACRTIHADVLLATGRWPEAERALESALAAHALCAGDGSADRGHAGGAPRPPGPPG